MAPCVHTRQWLGWREQSLFCGHCNFLIVVPRHFLSLTCMSLIFDFRPEWCSASPEFPSRLVPVLVPHCQQITGVVWAASLTREIRQRIFQDSLFPIQAVGTDYVSYPKPVSVASWPGDGSYRLSHLRLAIHPPA